MRLPASLRGGLFAAGGVVAASGLAWLGVHDAHRAFAAACLEIHGTTAMMLLILVGAAVALHAPAAWRERKNRLSGVLFAAGLALLILTAALLYYAADERLRAAASLVHWSVGLAAMALAVLHIALGRRTSA